MISFKANYIGKITINKINNNKHITPEEVSLVRLNANNTSDVNSLKKISENWDNNKTYAYKIYTDFCYRSIFSEDMPNQEVFAVTKQKNNLENLVPFAILGLMRIDKIKALPDNIYIDFLQTAPEHQYNSKNAIYKNIGKSLVNYLKNTFSNKTLIAFPNETSENFFKKIGFKREGLKMIFKK